MPITLTGTYTSTYVLSNPTTQNPATVASTGIIDAPTGIGIFGAVGTTWTVSNSGTIQSANTFGNPSLSPGGIVLLSGGTVDNTSTGRVSSDRAASILMHDGPSTVNNTGIIASAGASGSS